MEVIKGINYLNAWHSKRIEGRAQSGAENRNELERLLMGQCLFESRSESTNREKVAFMKGKVLPLCVTRDGATVCLKAFSAKKMIFNSVPNQKIFVQKGVTKFKHYFCN